MIAKRVNRAKGTSNFGRLVNYLLDTRERPELLYQSPHELAFDHAGSEKIAWFEMSHCEADNPALMIAEVEATQAQNTRSKNDKTYHLVVSFPAGERPSQEVIRDIEQTLCEGVGLGDHQRLLVVHQDTEHFHMHLAINKVHPETLRCVEPYYDHYKLNDLCRELERTHELQQDNRIEKDKERDTAREMEVHTGEQSFLSWMKEHVKEDVLQSLENAENWQHLHQAFGKYGLEIKPRGAGLAIGMPDKDLYVKASSLSRKLSMKALTERLGAYEAPSQAIERDLNLPKYAEAPLQKHPAANDLYARYKEQQQESRQERWREMQKLKSEHKRYCGELKSWYDRQYKNLRYSLFLTPEDKKARYKYLSNQRKLDMADQRERYALSKQAIFESTRCQTWTGFLQTQAQQGNGQALGILRGQEHRQARAREQLIKAESLEQARDIVYQDLKPKVLKNGTIIYRLRDGGQIRDEKGQIQVPEVTEGSVFMALMLAKERFPEQNLAIVGTEEFKRQVLRTSVDRGLDIKLADRDLEKEQQKLLRERNRSRSIEKYRGQDLDFER